MRRSALVLALSFLVLPGCLSSLQAKLDCGGSAFAQRQSGDAEPPGSFAAGNLRVYTWTALTEPACIEQHIEYGVTIDTRHPDPVVCGSTSPDVPPVTNLTKVVVKDGASGYGGEFQAERKAWTGGESWVYLGEFGMAMFDRPVALAVTAEAHMPSLGNKTADDACLGSLLERARITINYLKPKA